jgi:ribosomal protein S27AE
MTRYQPPTQLSASITRLPCPKCSTTMLLARIEPDIPGHELRTFECPRCEHSKGVISANSANLSGRVS